MSQAFDDLVKDVKVYDVPVPTDIEGVEDNSKLAAFKFAGNWYVGVKGEDGKLSANVDNWTVIQPSYFSDKFFYHGEELEESLNEKISIIFNWLDIKRGAGILPESEVIDTSVIASIAAAKEAEYSGLGANENNVVVQFINDNTITPFQNTQEEMLQSLEPRQNENQDDIEKNQKIALLVETGNAFSVYDPMNDAGERVFYVAISSSGETQIRRIKYGLKETNVAGQSEFSSQPAIAGTETANLPENTNQVERGVKPYISETIINMSDVVKEIGDKFIRNSPEATEYVKEQNQKSIQSLMKTLVEEYGSRQYVKNVVQTTVGERDHIVTHTMGDETTGKAIETNKLYRIMRDSDYVLDSDGDKVLDTKKADYIIVKTHENSENELIFFEGGTANCKKINCGTFVKAELLTKLYDLGVSVDTQLVNIGKEELAEIYQDRKIEEAIGYKELQARMNRGEKLESRPIMQYAAIASETPATFSLTLEDDRINGDISELRYGELYKIKDGIFVQIHKPLYEGAKPSFSSYTVQKSHEIEHSKTSCFLEGEFETQLIKSIKENGGSLTSANSHEIRLIADCLLEDKKASYELDALLGLGKAKLPDEIIDKLVVKAKTKQAPSQPQPIEADTTEPEPNPDPVQPAPTTPAYSTYQSSSQQTSSRSEPEGENKKTIGIIAFVAGAVTGLCAFLTGSEKTNEQGKKVEKSWVEKVGKAALAGAVAIGTVLTANEVYKRATQGNEAKEKGG